MINILQISLNYRLSNTCGQRPEVADFERDEAYGQISRQFVFKLASSLRRGATTPNLNCKNENFQKHENLGAS